MLSGKALIQVGIYKENKKDCGPLSRLVFRPGLFHSIKAISKEGVCALEFETPFNKNDLVRFKDDYGRQAKLYEGKKFTKKAGLNFIKFKKANSPLQQTKDVYKQRSRFEEKELKEFSILFLVINSLDIFRKNIELISEIVFSSKIMNEFKQKLIDYLLSEKFFERKKLEIEDFDQKFKDIINMISINAPVKIIYKNKSDREIVSIFNEIMEEIKKIELQEKIEFLEDKVSLNLNENLYSELLSLRNQLKKG